jgi:lysozyme
MRFPTESLVALVLAATAAPAFAGPARGVDVSYYDGHIDWARAKASGLDFAIIRVSDGLHTPDSQFQANWAGARAHGIVRGVYQFFRPQQDGAAQADLLLSRTQFEPGDLPPFLDVEVTDGVGHATMAARINAWVDRIKSRTGMTPLIYTSPGQWNGYRVPVPPGVGLWVAHWGVSSPRVPVGWSDWTFWQTGSASVPGVGAKADADVFHGTAAELRAFAAAHGPGGTGGGVTPTPPPSASHPILREGARGAEVVVLQNDLRRHGFNPGASDGVFGPVTLRAVLAFQRADGLATDGVVGPLTWAALSR